jgi:hypothetical protein
MEKSKAARAERKRTKANYLTMLEELDADFQACRHLFQPLMRTDLRRNAIADPEDEDHDRALRALDALPRVPGDEWRRGRADAARAAAADTAGDARLARVREARRSRRLGDKARRRGAGGPGSGEDRPDSDGSEV